MEPKYDYIIIGGGLAGLYTAYKINQSEPKAKLLILERNRQMGGRIDTINHKLEAGAGRFIS
jgi:protoporphyrinogen oxidase